MTQETLPLLKAPSSPLASVIIREITPIVINAVDGIHYGENKNGCWIKCRVNSGKNSVVLDINQEVERCSIPLNHFQWDTEKVNKLVGDEIEKLFNRGILNTVCRGIDDFIKLKLNVVPGYHLGISTLYSRTENIDIKSGTKGCDRLSLAVETSEQMENLYNTSLSIVKGYISDGLNKLNDKQTGKCGVSYAQEFFIRRDRVGTNESYGLINSSLLNGNIKPRLPPPSDYLYIIDVIRHFLDSKINLKEDTNMNYEINIQIDDASFDINSIYHRIIVHKCNERGVVR